MGDRAEHGSMSRRALMMAFAATTLTAAPGYAHAPAVLRGAGELRRIRMYCGRSGESVDTIYWLEGDYLPEAMSEISRFMRDWRNGKMKEIDPRTIDIMSAAHGLLETDEPYMLISGYRSPESNALLRRTSGGVGKKSRHLLGQAADIRLKSRSVEQIGEAAGSVAAGGVGRYSSSDFVHMDCGPVRLWGS